jgi:hypothetical protein
VPFLADRVGELTGFEDTRFLEVRVNRLPRWHLPGMVVARYLKLTPEADRAGAPMPAAVALLRS